MRRRKQSFYLFFLAFLASLAFVRAGATADVPEKPPLVHTISGFIDSRTLADFMRLLTAAKTNGAVALSLDSAGGQMGAANRIAGLIGYLERHGVKTHAHVNDQDRCLSACVVILAAAESRSAAPSAWIGLHGLRHARTGRLNRPAADRMLNYLRERGVDRDWLSDLDQAGVFDRHDLTSFDAAGLLQSGLVHDLRSNP